MSTEDIVLELRVEVAELREKLAAAEQRGWLLTSNLALAMGRLESTMETVQMHSRQVYELENQIAPLRRLRRARRRGMK
jgi:hypothetical protein